MTTFTIKKNQNTQFDIEAPDSKLILKEGVTIDSPGHGIWDAAVNFNNHIVIEGTTNGNGFGKSGIFIESEGARIDIANSGRVGGYFGVSTTGDNSRLVNNGQIKSDNVAVGMDGEASSFVNHGTVVSKFGYGYYADVATAEFTFENTGKVTSVYGLYFDSADLTATFGKESVVKSDHYVIEMITSMGEKAHIINHGELTATGDSFLTAIVGGAGEETVRNSGTISGNVELNGGDDRYDGRGGRVLDGVVVGGAGDDVYILDNKHTRVFDAIGSGEDRLTVSFSYRLEASCEMDEVRLAGKADIKLIGNDLHGYLGGNAGDNKISGKGGEDSIFGGKGDDILTGGADGDIFYFKPHADRETITDFADGMDYLIFTAGKDIKSIDDLLAHHVHQQGDDLVISGDGTEMIIRNLDKANFDATDFLT